jgi:hypothetical protein
LKRQINAYSWKHFVCSLTNRLVAFAAQGIRIGLAEKTPCTRHSDKSAHREQWLHPCQQQAKYINAVVYESGQMLAVSSALQGAQLAIRLLGSTAICT